MTTAAKRIELEIRQLPLEDMLVLHEHLVASIHEKEDAEPLDPAFRGEIQRRVKRLANEAMPSSRITHVYFTEFVIQ